MQSFLVLGKIDKTSIYISSFLKKEKIDPIDIDEQIYEKAVGIEDVRNIQKKILLKPFRGKTKAVVINAYENITPEAQNALLKTLEEPPANTIIIIACSKKELVLPTIISRCEIIELKEEVISTTDDDISKFNKALSMIFNNGVGDKLRIAQDIGNKEEAVVWLSKMSVFVRSKLIENHNDSKYLELLKQMQQAHKNIKSTNASHRIALENLFLSL